MNNRTINLPRQAELSPFSTKLASHSQTLLDEPHTEFATEQTLGSAEQSAPRRPENNKVYIVII